MSHKLTGVQLRTALRRLGDIQRQVGQKEYPHDPEELLIALQALGEGRFEIKGGVVEVTLFACERLALELIPEYENKGTRKKWLVVEDVEPTFVEGCQLDFLSFLEGGESSVNGDVMRSRAKANNAVPGLADAKFVLANQHLIPENMRGKYLVFAGTVLRSPDGSLSVPFLYWGVDRWVLRFAWLSYDWDGGGRLVSRK